MAFIAAMPAILSGAATSLAAGAAWLTTRITKMSKQLHTLENEMNEASKGATYLSELLRPLALSTERAIKKFSPHMKQIALAMTCTCIVSTGVLVTLTYEVRELRLLAKEIVQENRQVRMDQQTERGGQTAAESAPCSGTTARPADLKKQ